MIMSWLRLSATLFVLLLALPVFAESGIFKYNEQKRLQDWAGALETIREELEKPAFTADEYLMSMNIVAISALGNYVYSTGVNSKALDAEALQYYESALRYAGDDMSQRVLAINVLALFYSKSGRNGQAVVYIRQALRHWRASGDKFQIIKGYNDLASTFGDQGEIELETYYRRKALEEAAGYYRIGSFPEHGSQQWVSYVDFLKAYADDMAAAGEESELERIWSIYRQVSDNYLQLRTLSYISMAEYFAISGNTKRARALLREGQRIWKGERAKFQSVAAKGDADIICTETRIELAAQRYDRAVDLFDECIKRFVALGIAPGPSIYRLRANALEATGALDKAIENYQRSISLLERVRSSYSVAERAATFNNPTFREPYWGLIRAFAKRGSLSGAPEDFFTALQATERIRARQFGELLSEAEAAQVTAAQLQALAENLPSDAVVLDYILMGRTIVVLAFTRGGRKISVIPYDRDAFNERARNIADLLADSSSSLPDLNRRLRETSDLLIRDMRPLLVGKRRVLLLQDGTMNLIPFGLFSADAKRYRPMIEDKVVQIVPSLRFLIRTSKQKAASSSSGLFAVGDPAYRSSFSAAGLSQEEMRQVSRGSSYLKYFQRLPGTRREVLSISGLFDSKNVKTLFGREATESAIKTANLYGFKYVHLATHGILGGEVPGIGEPALVFADEKDEDGLLKASEAAQLKLNADMTVLSACNTGSGKLVVGEGVLGMSRAFLLAGSRSVVVSLWSVSDAATAHLMTQLYRYRRAGRSGPEALRLAALDVRKVQSHPVFWAPFIFVGN